MVELTATASDGSVILALTAELLELTFKEVFPVRADKDVDSFESEFFISPIADIAVFFVSILF